MEQQTSKYLEFRRMPPKPKTQVWDVLSKSDKSVLGTIKWHGNWSQYCFFPNLEFDSTGSTYKTRFLTFSSGCMVDIIAFMKVLNSYRKCSSKRSL